MIAVKRPVEIDKYHEKIFFHMSIRQLCGTIIALAIGIPFYIFGSKLIGSDMASTITALVVLPILGVSWVTIKGVTLDKMLMRRLHHMFMIKKRTYKTEPLLKEVIEEMTAKETTLTEKEIRKEKRADEKFKAKKAKIERKIGEYQGVEASETDC